MATTPTTSPTTRSTSCCSQAGPGSGRGVGLEPTISRFENGVGRSALYALGRELAMRVIGGISDSGWPGAADHVDLDPTDDATMAPSSHLLNGLLR